MRPGGDGNGINAHRLIGAGAGADSGGCFGRPTLVSSSIPEFDSFLVSIELLAAEV